MRKLLVAMLPLLTACNDPSPPPVAPEPPVEAPAASSAEPEGAPEATDAGTKPSGDAAGVPVVPVDPATLGNDVAQANELAARWHQAIARRDRGNVFTSPTSLRMALAAVYAGAEGETAAELRRALVLAEGPSQVADAVKAERAALAKLAGPKVELRLANRLWGDRQTQLESSFVELGKKGWGAPLEPLDFRGAPDPSRQAINAWVSKETNKRIPELLPGGSITPLTRLVVTNAVYFDGKWQSPFDAGKTRPKGFYRSAGVVDVPFMHQTNGCPYADLGEVRLLSLPYGDRGAVSMVIALPKSFDGLGVVEAQLSAATFERWQRALAEGGERLEIALPKLELRWGGSVRPILQDLGARRVFGDQAELEGIQKGGDLYLSDVFHQGFVRVDESGTEAAAATGAVVATRSMQPVSVPFVVDRPFLFYLRDTSSGRVLFLGRVVDPSLK